MTLPANSTCSLTFSSALSESLACIVSFFSLQIFLLVRGLITGFARHLCLFRGKPQAVQFWQLRFLLDCKTTVLNRTITCPHVHTRLLLAHNNPHFAHDFLGVCTWGNSSVYFFFTLVAVDDHTCTPVSSGPQINHIFRKSSQVDSLLMRSSLISHPMGFFMISYQKPPPIARSYWSVFDLKKLPRGDFLK